MNWLLSIFFPRLDTTIKIRRDFLPGLKAPTVAPKIPKRPKHQSPNQPELQELYKRFKASHPNKPQRQARTKDEVDFS